MPIKKIVSPQDDVARNEAEWAYLISRFDLSIICGASVEFR
jgi:hypothetical protein